MRYVIVHGHFYQPPRENPWTERIGQEVSAAPFHNWNARIQRECYGPNRAARILNADKRISAIVNNYERISFNVGPTLLDWMRRGDPVTVEALVEADRRSAERLGHGNALAQGYNHAILPLLDRRDKRTQVLWGQAHFRRMFGREPEGMWLPETAADLETLDVLAEAGVRFTVLAPWQMAALRPDSGSVWRDRGHGDDLGRAYRCVTAPGREIALFFYDGDAAREVAFERLLDDGAAFAARLRAGALGRPAEAPLFHLATDGETYGHHHRFGEMALAYALARLGEDPEVAVTNYAAFLEGNPARWEARILEPGSWSCMHGVERWRSDCGCSTGGEPGWNQKWRAPLFEALAGLRRRLAGVFEEAGSGVFRDPWAARDAYIEVLLDPDPQHRAAFLEDHALPRAEPRRAWRLLEMERHALLMFTSCGWFFNDLAGIETLQVLRYAARALELCGEDAPEGLTRSMLETLDRAETNRKPVRSGAGLYREVVRRSRVDAARVAAEGALARRLGLDRGAVVPPPAFSVTVTPAGGREEGTVEVVHRRTEDRSAFYYVVVMDASPKLEVRLQASALRPAGSAASGSGDAPRELVVGVEELDPESAQILTDQFLDRLDRKVVLRLGNLVRNRDAVVRFLEQRRIRPPRALGRVLEVVWMRELLQEIRLPAGSRGSEPFTWGERLDRFSDLGLARNDARLAEALAQRLHLETERLCRDPSEGAARTLLAILEVAERLSPVPDFWEAQNHFFECSVRRRRAGAGAVPPGFPAGLRREVAERLGFAPAVLDL